MTGGDLTAAFERQLAAEQGQNRYDEAVHATARRVGKLAGTAAQLAVPAMGLSKLAGAKRMAEAAPMLLREVSKLAGAGAVGGATAQGVDDLVTGKRSSLGDYGGSVIGGGAGTLAAIYGRLGYAGSAAGAATSLAQDALNGRIRSSSDLYSMSDRAMRAAANGNVLSLPVAGYVASKVNRLPGRKAKGSLDKGALGEWLSKQRSGFRGEKVTANRDRIYVKGGYSIPDHVNASGQIVEAKLGHAAKLSKAQRAVRAKDPDNYRIDHFLAKDFGATAEIPAWILSHPFYDQNHR